MPSFLITEYFVNFADRTSEVAVDPLVPVDGYIELPTAPGLGIEISEARLREHVVDGLGERDWSPQRSTEQ